MTLVNEYVMDEVSRVRNIKERFETISNTSQCNRLDKNSTRKNSYIDQGDVNSIETPKDRPGPLCTNIELISSARTNIKRKPAFRRDKIPTRSTDCCTKPKPSIVSRRVRLFNDMDDIENLGMRESVPMKLTANNTSTLVSESEDDMKQLYSRIKKCTKNSKIGQPSLDTLNWNSAENNVHDKNVTNFTDECGSAVETSDSKKIKSQLAKRQLPNEVSNELSDTLKRILKCPLPSGPPPRKPPRTFAANSESSPLSEEKIQRPQRSKTETEIKLKKIENALGKHQKSVFSPHSPARKILLSSAATSTMEKYAGINKNRRRSTDRDMTGQSLCLPDLKDSIRSKSESCASLPPVPRTFSVFQETDDGHIYEEPKSLNSSMTSPCEDVEVTSLYYMSVPIDRIINSSERRNLSEAPNSKVEPNYVFGTHSIQEVNAKCQNAISMDNKIKLWVNEAYSNLRTKSSDGSSDSDSVFSVSPDDLMSRSREERSSGDQYSQLTMTRKGYCQKVASKAISRNHSVRIHDASDCKHLFECLLLIGLNLDVHNENVPYIKLKYPTHIDVPQSIEHMCFPDAHEWYNRTSQKTNYDNLDEDRCYVIPLTNEAGLRKYAYCRRIKPEGESSSLPLSYCILSSHKANEFYFSILEEVENRHGQSDVEFSTFIKELYENKFPSKGQGIKITPFSEENGEDKANADMLMRPSDARLEDLRLAKSLAYLKINTFLLIFSSLLLERKVILLSHSISKLSTCIEGLQVALLPFEWQHTLITVVPSNVISVSDLCDAPTPYLIGLLKPKNNPTRVLSYLNNKMQVLVVDLDERKALRRVGDENSILPNHLAKGVKNALQLAHSSEMHTNNLLACEAFTRLFVEAVGHYERYIISSGNDRNYVKSFQKEAFVNHGRSHQIRMFLEWFVETAAFSIFVDVRLQSKTYSRGLFEVRCKEYSDELIRSKQEKNNKLNKTVKQIGDLLKDWAT